MIHFNHNRSESTATTSIGTLLNLGKVDVHEVLDMLDWLNKRKPFIERTLAKRHLVEGTMILYDVSSSYFEGSKCILSAFGYSRDKRRDKRQVVFGLLCTQEGCPIAIEVFTGNTADPRTLGTQIAKIKKRFGLSRVILVGDRGMITSARVEKELKPEGIDWITALRSRDIRRLMVDDPSVQPGYLWKDLVDEQQDEIGEISSDLYPGERLMVCVNPRLREDRRKTREELLTITDSYLEKIEKSVQNGTLETAEQINRKVGQMIGKRNMAKHYQVKVSDGSIVWKRLTEKIKAEEALDGIYVVRTNVLSSELGTSETVEAYKSLSFVEQAFRSIKTTSLRIRPIYVYSEAHVRGHVFLCMLGYYMEWHLKRELAPLLFIDEHKDKAKEKRTTPVGKAQVSDSAIKKQNTRTTEDGHPVHSFKTLMHDLGTLTLNEVSPPGNPDRLIHVMSQATEIQRRALELIGIDQNKMCPLK